ncbi:kinase-like domain-containing protein [Suillus subalutaceus]|uniref:kinase-like domain-containing protein n=1 Tax=Suillus subalutaceus TaxID=48586 RepID=UPI001B862288|nr:kinase-like domain-containing protein [Suillus subalutaceus]KAG1862748.1 kinase-like domain-containing protein [Suillus subalutaceus]
MFCLRTLRELKLLKFLSEAGVSENIISILDIIKPPSLDAFKEVYLIQELMETDMYRVIRTQDLSDDHAQYFIYQALRTLETLHSADVIHRDLKPSNLLLNANCDLKVCNFELARSVKKDRRTIRDGNRVYDRICRYTKVFRESISAKMHPTDQTSIALVYCLNVNMISGARYHNLGCSRYTDAGRVLRHYHTQIARLYPSSSFPQTPAICANLPQANPLAVDFLAKTLTFDPKKRITVEEVLAHPYLEAYHDPDDEPVAPPLDPEFFEFDLIVFGGTQGRYQP